MARDKSAEKLTDSQIYNILLDYFGKQMKPYAINDIINNLNLVSYKKQVLTALEQLTEKNHLVSKQFGKSTIWVFAFTKEDNSKEEIDTNDVQNEITEVNEKIVEGTNKKKSLIVKKQKFDKFLQNPEELKNALITSQSSIEEKLLIKDEILEKIKTIKNSKSDSSVDLDEINKKIHQLRKRAKTLIAIEKTLSDMILLCVPTIKKQNLKDFLIDEIGCEQITINL